MSSEVQVQVELYVEGQGPVQVFSEPLKGYTQNRLDLERIMRTHNLKAIYAFSSTSGRGNRLFWDPRNGLSRIAYSGKPDAIIRLDGDPTEPFSLMLGKLLFGFVLIGGLACLTLADSLPDWLGFFRDSGRSYFVVLTCFVTMLYSQLVWRPMKKRRHTMYGGARSQQNIELSEERVEGKKAV